MNQSDITVLIVDDIPANIQIAANIIHKEGYNIIMARSGLEALEAVKKHKLHLILLDIMMPGMDGFEVCRRLKANPETKSIPIIFVTAKTDVESLAEGFELGAVDYVTKPFNHTIMLSRIKTQVAQYRLKQEIYKEHSLLTSILQDSPFIFCRISPDFRLIYVNEGFKTFFNTGNHPLTGAIITDIMPENIGRLPVEKLKNLNVENPIQKTTIVLKSNEGKKKTISWVCRCVLNEDRNIIAYQCFGEDVTEQQAMIEKINERNVILEHTQKAGRILNWTYTPDDERIHCDKTLNQIVGNIDTTFKLSTAFKLAHPSDHSIIKENIDTYLSDKASEMDFIVRALLNNNLFFFRIIGLKDQKNGQLIYRGLMQDITELMLSRRKNQQLQKEHQSIFEAVGEGIIQFSLDHTIIQANKAAAEMAGLKKGADLVGKKCYQVFYNRTEPCDICTSQQALRLGKRVQIEKPVDSRRVWNVASTPLYDENGKAVSIIEVLSDVSNIYEQRQKLLLSEERLSTALEAALIGTYTIDFENDNWIPDEQLKKLLLIKEKKHYTLMDLYRHIHPEDFPMMEYDLKNYLSGKEKKFHTEFRVQYDEDEFRYFRCTGQTLELTSRQKPKTLMGVIIDISKEKNMMETIRHQEETLAQSRKLKAMGQLAGGVAHDFNNMLSTILGFAELIEDDVAGNDELTHYVKTIMNTCERASSLTQQLMSFSRKKHSHTETVNIHDMLTNSLELLKRSLQSEIDIQYDFHAEHFHVMGDYSQLQNVILNMGFNSRDAMPRGGLFKITTENVSLNEADCLNASFDVLPGYFIRISVEDTGEGMDKKTLEKIFDPFFTTKEVGKGTGLGLASSYGTINSHKGCINVESKVGKGTVFNLYFPLSEKIETDEKRTVKTIHRGSGTVLVVDDEKPIREMLKKMLTSLGYSVLLSEDGYAGIEKYKKNQSDIVCVILDVMMPNLDGDKTYEYLKEIDPNVVTIISSGYASSEKIESLKKRGVKAFLKKPYRKNQLSEILALVLE